LSKLFLLFFLLTSSLFSKVIISPYDAMKNVFVESDDVSKKNVLLTKSKASYVQKTSKIKLGSKIFRTFKASKNGTDGEILLGYGILVSRNVRSKSAAILYMIDTTKTIKAVEIIAFNEPPEFIPNKKWMSQFENKQTKDNLFLGKAIPTISGATLSARNVADGSRIALAVADLLFKK
jgi:Na+-translocating ferredoxin:NAD+ oxidoreductase subunit G